MQRRTRAIFTQYADVTINPSEVLEDLRKEYIRSILDVGDAWIRNGTWETEDCLGSHSSTDKLRPATTQEVRVVEAFDILIRETLPELEKKQKTKAGGD
jgi:hypothetical protein